MNNIALTIIGILIGVVVTVMVGAYYFRKSVEKKLTIYILLSKNIFGESHETIKDKLKLVHNSKDVTDPFMIHYLIVNEGAVAIQNIIEPLTLKLPTGVHVLDASVLNIHPEGRKIDLSLSYDDEQSKIEVHFPLLNKEERFTLQLLLDGKIDSENESFEITVENISPLITPKRMPEDAVEARRKRQLDKSTQFFVIGTIFLVAGILDFSMFLLASTSSDEFLLLVNNSISENFQELFSKVNNVMLAGWGFSGILLILFGLVSYAVGAERYRDRRNRIKAFIATPD